MNKLRNPYLVVTVKCAAPGCTSVRREANHWFVISIEQGRFTCCHYLPATALRASDVPACGQACAQKLFERYLARSASPPFPP
ncbi:MAG TPA: hypothetical protein VGK24_09245 [Candidatus Angelobacter sp.]